MTSKSFWPDTRWTLLVQMQSSDPEMANRALDRWVRIYQPCITRFFRIAGRGHDAEDLTQDFFVMILERSTLQRARKEHGTFHAFLAKVLRDFYADRCDFESAQKRGGLNVHLSRDDDTLSAPSRDAMEPRDYVTPEEVWNALYVRYTVLVHASELISSTPEGPKREYLEATLQKLLAEFSFDDAPASLEDDDVIARRFGETVESVRQKRSRLKQKLGERLHEHLELGSTDPTTVKSQIRQLQRAHERLRRLERLRPADA